MTASKGVNTKHNSLTQEQKKKAIRLISSRAKVNENCCWIINKGEKRYAKVSIGEGTILAHRLSYMAFNGDIPENLFVCHKCDVKNCVNPDHLFVGTHHENMMDAYQKERIKLAFTDDQVNRVRSMHEDGYTPTQLGDIYNVDHETIRNVVLGKTYKHVKREDIRFSQSMPFSIEHGPVLEKSQ